MFEAILAQINKILGRDYGCFLNFNPNTKEAREIMKQHENIAGLYVENGSLQLLSGNQGMQVDTVLQISFKVKEKDNTSARMQLVSDRLVEQANGIIESVQSDGTTAAYKYILSFGVPRTDGNVVTLSNEKDAARYVTYQIPITFVITRDLLFGDELLFEWKVGGTFRKVEGITSFTLSPNVQFDTSTFISDNQNRSEVVAGNWGAQLVFSFKPQDSVHKAIYNAMTVNLYQPQTVQYSIDGGATYTQKMVILHDCNAAFLKRQFTVLSLNMSTAVN